jgi:phosphatidylinositol alpha-1,6-mannosyltransferase
MVLITPLFPPGGGGAAVVHYQLCKELGREACALVPSSRGCEARLFDSEQSFPIIRLPFLASKPAQHGPRWLRAAWNIIGRRLLPRIPLALLLTRHLRRLRPDVVCLGGLGSLYWILPLVRWISRSKVVFYIHGEEVSGCKSLGAISQRFHNRSIAMMKKADAVVAVSEWTAQRIREVGVPQEKVKVIHNGVDHLRFSPGPADEGIKARHHLAGKRTILTVARLDSRKGHETVLRAIPEVLQAFPNVVYVIVGDGPQRAALERLVRSLGIDEHVVFAGGVSDAEIPAYYRTCEIFVQPNRRMPDGDDEGFGLVFLEAGACRRPVVGGRSGGVPEAVVDGETGILVNGDSVKETGDAIIRLLGNPELSSRMATAGWSWSRRFDWRKTATEFRSICQEDGETNSGRAQKTESSLVSTHAPASVATTESSEVLANLEVSVKR